MESKEDLILRAAFFHLRDSDYFSVFMKWLKTRCYGDVSSIVAGDPVQTYANEHLRDLWLEIEDKMKEEPKHEWRTEPEPDADAYTPD